MAFSLDPDVWRAWPLGTRVTVRSRICDPLHKYSDTIGVILESDSEGLLLDTRKGEVRVVGADILLGKPVPPPPERRVRS